MFDAQSPQKPRVASNPPEDIFSGVDHEPTPPPTPPMPAGIPARAPVAPPRPTNPPVFEGGGALPAGLDPSEHFSAPPAPPVTSGGAMPRVHRSATKVVLIMVTLAVIVLAAFLLAGLILRSRKAPVPEATPSERTTPPVDVTIPLEEALDESADAFSFPEPTFEDEELADEPAPVLAADADRDGLTDDEEAALGTSARSSDTDNDGLSDRDEVKVWGTNPLNPDTDGDSYLDGQEVRNGFDPKGPGKLLIVPKS